MTTLQIQTKVARLQVTTMLDTTVVLGTGFRFLDGSFCLSCRRRIFHRWRWLARLLGWWHKKSCPVWLVHDVTHTWDNSRAATTEMKLTQLKRTRWANWLIPFRHRKLSTVQILSMTLEER